MISVGWCSLRRFLFLCLVSGVTLTPAATVCAQAQTSPIDSPSEKTSDTAVKASQSVSSPAGARPELSPPASLRLGPGDLVEVSVYNVPELATKTRIGSNGDVYLPLVDYVHVAGLTTEEAQGVIERRLSGGAFVKDPHVSLFVDEYANQGASVLGEVAKPGVYAVKGQQKLFDLLSAAGGLTDKAGKTVTLTHRDHPDKPIQVALARNLGDNPQSNADVFPGDTVIVHKADVIYVVGDVAKPSGFLMDHGSLTVLQAVALAGGATGTAKLNGARIIRKGPGGMSETPVELKKILAAKSPDIAMSADDILFVPTSQSRVFGKRGIEAAIQAATAVSIYSIR